MRVVPAACALLALAACAHAWSPFLDRLLRPGAAGERRAGYSAQAELDAVHHLPGWGKPAHGLFSGCGRAPVKSVFSRRCPPPAATRCALPCAARPAEQRARAAQVRHGERDRRPRPVLRIRGGRGGRVAAARAVAQVRTRPARAGCWWRALGPLTGRAPRAGSGGPGCSSLAGGFLSELGPYYPTNQPGRLQRNDFTWTQAANIIFLESPAFVGWSYSNTSADAVVGAPSRLLAPAAAAGQGCGRERARGPRRRRAHRRRHVHVPGEVCGALPRVRGPAALGGGRVLRRPLRAPAAAPGLHAAEPGLHAGARPRARRRAARRCPTWRSRSCGASAARAAARSASTCRASSWVRRRRPRRRAAPAQLGPR